MRRDWNWRNWNHVYIRDEKSEDQRELKDRRSNGQQRNIQGNKSQNVRDVTWNYRKNWVKRWKMDRPGWWKLKQESYEHGKSIRSSESRFLSSRYSNVMQMLCKSSLTWRRLKCTEVNSGWMDYGGTQWNKKSVEVAIQGRSLSSRWNCRWTLKQFC